MKRDEVMTVGELIKELEKMDKSAPVVVDGDDGRYSLSGCVYGAVFALGEATIEFESGEITDEEEYEDDYDSDFEFERQREARLYDEEM